jgi:diguanylate cyclase (GGDEF)-like protein
VRKHLGLVGTQEAELLEAIDEVIGRQRRLWQQSKQEAIQALSEGFADKISLLQTELTAREAKVSTIAQYFEEVVAELTEKSHRDPKTKLLNFDWFMERLESFLAVEQRVRWCGVGVVDITGFKAFNDVYGHAIGDKIIERVARILAEQIRSEDLLALERPVEGRNLHARFGGDEFCFLIPDLPGAQQATQIASRFKRAVESHEWSREDSSLAAQPVSVDVGVVCLWLGAVIERRGVARKLAADLIQWADRLMYNAKGQRSADVHMCRVRVDQGQLIEMREEDDRRTGPGDRRGEPA